MNQTGNKTAPLSLPGQKKYLLGAGIVLGIIAIIYGCIQAFSSEPNTGKSIAAAETNNKPKKRKQVWHL